MASSILGQKTQYIQKHDKNQIRFNVSKLEFWLSLAESPELWHPFYTPNPVTKVKLKEFFQLKWCFGWGSFYLSWITLFFSPHKFVELNYFFMPLRRSIMSLMRKERKPMGKMLLSVGWNSFVLSHTTLSSVNWSDIQVWPLKYLGYLLLMKLNENLFVYVYPEIAFSYLRWKHTACQTSIPENDCMHTSVPGFPMEKDNVIGPSVRVSNALALKSGDN